MHACIQVVNNLIMHQHLNVPTYLLCMEFHQYMTSVCCSVIEELLVFLSFNNGGTTYLERLRAHLNRGGLIQIMFQFILVKISLSQTQYLARILRSVAMIN